jgi:hypothetical protein
MEEVYSGTRLRNERGVYEGVFWKLAGSCRTTSLSSGRLSGQFKGDEA